MRLVLFFIAAVTMAAAPASAPGYKVSGSATAPVTIELFTDYACPHCAAFTAQAIPQLDAQFVKTGKVRLIHRDIPSSANSEKAARYANAAGQLGYFDVAARQIFKTQGIWMQNGDVDSQLKAVIPPGAMQKIRDVVKNDKKLGDSIQADAAQAQAEKLTHVPGMIFTTKTKHDKVEGEMAYFLLRSYINQLLAAK